MPDLTHRPLPDSVAAELDDPTLAEGEWTPGDCDGRTLFDTPSAADGSLTVVFARESFGKWRSQALLSIESADRREYLAQVTAGPYAAPIGLAAGSHTMVTAQAEGSLFTPPYHGWCEVELLGERRGDQTVVPLLRPLPNSPARLLNPAETRAMLNVGGDILLGDAIGFEELTVGLNSTDKAHLPRHTLAVGTTGAGKSTFLAGFIEKLAARDFCVVLLDVEGEYASLYKPAESDRIVPALEARGLAPAGVPNSYLLVPPDAEPSDPGHPSIRRFCVAFENLPLHVVTEIVGGNEAQTERFELAYEWACSTLAEVNRELGRAEYDEAEVGYPGLRLAHVFDAAIVARSLVQKEEPQQHDLHADGFRPHFDALVNKIRAASKQLSSGSSWGKTVSLVGKLYKSNLFDRHGTASKSGEKITALDFDKMVQPGRVLVLDLAGIDSAAHRNLVISDVLRGVNAAQDRLYHATPPGGERPRTVIIIEEAHEFLSGERVAKMPAVFEQIQRIARRGRKRWLGLVFATQFPQHLPAELFTLCNNRILMRLADEPTIRKLQHSVGGVGEGLWARLKNLPTGQAIVSAHGIEPALLVSLEPGRCMLRMVD